jgi:hypothetical protein
MPNRNRFQGCKKTTQGDDTCGSKKAHTKEGKFNGTGKMQITEDINLMSLRTCTHGHCRHARNNKPYSKHGKQKLQETPVPSRLLSHMKLSFIKYN